MLDRKDLEKKSEQFDIKKGAHFFAIVFEDYVIKIQKEKLNKKYGEDYLEEIEECCNTLSSEFDEVLPCVKKGQSLVMPKAPGKNKREFSRDKRGDIRNRAKKIACEARLHGYDLKATWTDCFYDEKTDSIYLVDYSQIRKL